MQVLKTTSPSPATSAPNSSPGYTWPSSRTSAPGRVTASARKVSRRAGARSGGQDVVGHAPTGDRQQHPPGQDAAGQRGVVAAREEALGVDRPGRRGVEEDQVGRITGA